MSLPSKSMRSVRALRVPCPRRSPGPLNNGRDFHTSLSLSCDGSWLIQPCKTLTLMFGKNSGRLQRGLQGWVDSPSHIGYVFCLRFTKWPKPTDVSAER